MFCFRADFGFSDCCVVVLVGLLQHKGVLNETLFFLEIALTLYDLDSLGTLNSRMPRWMDVAYGSNVYGLVESLKT